MILRAAIVLVIVAAASVAHAGKRDCVAIGKGKVVYADASKRHPVGTTTKKISGVVEQRKGAWVKVRLDDLLMDEGGSVLTQSHVFVFVRKRDVKRGSCPPKPNTVRMVAQAIDDEPPWVDLVWRTGDEAGAADTDDFRSQTRCNGEDVVIGESKLRCGAWSPVDGLALDVCAAVHAPPGGDLGAALGHDPCAE